MRIGRAGPFLSGGLKTPRRRVDHRGVSPRTISVPSPAAGATGCRIVELPRIADPRGNLTFLEGDEHVPFPIRHVDCIYDVPGGASRGGHAHRQLEQFIIAMAGSFEVHVDDGRHTEVFQLDRSYYGLYVPPMVWREMARFSSASVGLVVASHHYDEADYLRDYDAFVAAARSA